MRTLLAKALICVPLLLVLGLCAYAALTQVRVAAPVRRGDWLGGGGFMGGGGSGGCGGGASGTITGVLAGNGLSGGGTTGAVTLNALNSLDYAGTHLEWTDEWLQNACGVSNTACGSIWSGIFTGAGASIQSTGATTRPGVIQLTTGTTTAGLSRLQTSASAVDLGSGSWTMEFVGGFEALSTGTDEYAAWIGLGDTAGVNQVDGCGFLYDRGNVATSGVNTGNANTLSCYCANSSARTIFLMDGTTVSDESFTTVSAPVSALVLPDANILSLKVQMTGSTRAEFFVNGVKSCDIATHIPSGVARLTGAIAIIVKSAGTTARTMDIDRTRVAVDLASARAP